MHGPGCTRCTLNPPKVQARQSRCTRLRNSHYAILGRHAGAKATPVLSDCLFVLPASAATPAARLAPPAQDCPSPIIAIPSAVAVGDVSCNLTFGTTRWNAVPAAGYQPSGADKAAEPCAPGTAKAGPGSFT